jgi:hypothetical protein
MLSVQIIPGATVNARFVRNLDSQIQRERPGRRFGQSLVSRLKAREGDLMIALARAFNE